MFDQQTAFRFDGPDIESFDVERLGRQLRGVYDVMRDGNWRTLAEIRRAMGFGTEASISARLRDLRKPEYASHVVDRRRRGNPSDGLFEYRLEVQG